MPRINLLPFAIANLIAAGEVVDRPASVVKELIENSIDAGATRINVEIQNGGVSLIRISDNGCGISVDDLPTAILRHATSKIQEVDDLGRIMTLGFRGEALAATAAVSQMRIISKTADQEYGALMTVKAGDVVSIEERGAVTGTTVIVENLFYNVPARLKFLKRDATEALAVTSVVEKMALAHPEICFHYLIDGMTKFLTAGDGNRKSVLTHFYGRTFTDRLIEIDSGEGAVHIEGYISRPDNVKPTRNYQNYFLNGRYIRSRTICAAFEQAYTSFIAPEKFPCCTLYVTLNPSLVDINVHPAKLEVKFSNEKQVFDTVYYAVRSALEMNRARPEMDLMRAAESGGFTPASSEEHLATVAAEEEKAARKRVSDAFVPVTDRVAEADPPKQMRIDVGLPTRSSRRDAFLSDVTEETVSLPPNSHREAAERNVPSETVPQKNAPTAPAAPPPVLTKSQSRAVRAAVQENLSDALQSETQSSALMGNPPAPEPPTDRCTPEATPQSSEETTAPKTTETKAGPALPTEQIPKESAPKPHMQEEKPSETLSDVLAATAPVIMVPEGEDRTSDYRIIGEAFNSYILVERRRDDAPELLLVDKHAAHERIIFERLKAQMKKNLAESAQASQFLLVPMDFMINTSELNAILSFEKEIRSIGFEFSHRAFSVSVTAIPIGFAMNAVEDFFRTVGESLSEYGGDPTLKRDILFEKALYQVACKAAVKAGRVYTEESNEYIIRALMNDPDITCCPHGRPVAIVLPKKKLDSQFKRT